MPKRPTCVENYHRLIEEAAEKKKPTKFKLSWDQSVVLNAAEDAKRKAVGLPKQDPIRPSRIINMAEHVTYWNKTIK